MVTSRTSLLVPLAALASLPAQNPGQHSRTLAEVTPAGVFFESAKMPGAQAPLGINPSPRGLRWTYPQTSTFSILNSVSAGNHGTFAWLACNLNNERLSLVSTTDDNSNPPVPVYEASLLGADFVSVKAADKGRASAVAVITGGAGTLDYYRSNSATPTWTVNYATGFEIAISETGRYVAAGFTSAPNTSQVDVYDATSATPTTPIRSVTAASHGFRHLDLSGDGSTILLATNTRDHVFDVATGAELFNTTTVSHDAHAINRDGTVFGRAGFNPIRAFVRTGATYQMVLDYVDSSLGFAVHTAAGISADGSTFACAGFDAQANARMRVFCWRLTATGSTLLWNFASDGTGQFQATPQAVSISDDGKYIAVGTWGTEFNDHDECLIFDRDAGGTPIATVNTPGSVFDLDISGDGQFVVIGTKAVHANTFGNGGEGYSFDRGGQGHWLSGTPSIGRAIQLRTGGRVGEPVFVGFASALGTPITVPGISGTFNLDLGSFSGFLSVGNVPGSGVHALPLTVPNVPFFIGLSVYTQALTAITPTFSNTLLLSLTP